MGYYNESTWVLMSPHGLFEHFFIGYQNGSAEIFTWFRKVSNMDLASSKPASTFVTYRHHIKLG